MTTLLTWTYVAGYDSRRGVSHRDSRPSALANLRYRRGVPTGRINRNRARRAGAAPARARAVPGSHRAKRQRRAQRTCVHRGRGRPLGRTSTAELNRTSAVLQLPPPVEPGHGDQIPGTCQTGSTPARTPATVGRSHDPPWQDGHHERTTRLRHREDHHHHRLDPFPWHTWRNDIRIRVDDDQLAVEDSVIGWRRILCITCDTDLWSAHRQ